MPPNMARWVRGRVEAGNFISISDYFRDLVRGDQQRQRIDAAVRRNMDEHRQKAIDSHGTTRRR